jgi:acetyl-CoA carboxylase carboxyl transferase subunit beta
VSWFRRKKTAREPIQDRRFQMPEGIWKKCGGCKEVLYAKAVQDNGMSCPRCDFHFAISVEERIALLMDPDGLEEIERDLYSVDPLKFKDQVAYKDRLKKYQDKTGRADAVVILRGSIQGRKVIACVMDFGFLGGSLGSVVGEKLTRGAETALAERLPLIIVCASGGARMQEGALSLMQMAKINAALGRLHEAGLPYISVLTNPTTGGVSASFAMVGDVIMAEPGALIGFAGPRVIEQTIGQKLPEGFQRSEFLLAKGMVDMVVPRREMRDRLSSCLAFFMGRPAEADKTVQSGDEDPAREATPANATEGDAEAIAPELPPADPGSTESAGDYAH